MLLTCLTAVRHGFNQYCVSTCILARQFNRIPPSGRQKFVRVGDKPTDSRPILAGSKLSNNQFRWDIHLTKSNFRRTYQIINILARFPVVLRSQGPRLIFGLIKWYQFGSAVKDLCSSTYSWLAWLIESRFCKETRIYAGLQIESGFSNTFRVR